MKNKTAITLLATVAMALGVATPSFAGAKGVVGAAVATVVDVPQAIVVDTLYYCPKKCWHHLAVALGDNPKSDFGNCFVGQNLVGAVVGVPFGMVWGVPSGFLRGAKHGMGTGYDKPFSGESFSVLSYDEK